MLRLIILRHVCANHTIPGQRDIERIISENGAKSLAAISNTILQNNYVPDTIYCSPAVRTRQTLLGVESSFHNRSQGHPQVFMPENLYAGVTNDYFNTICEHENTGTLMLIGHNPMCSDLAYSLYSTGASELLSKLVLGFGAGSLAVIDFNIDHWSDLKNNSGNMIDFQDHIV